MLLRRVCVRGTTGAWSARCRRRPPAMPGSLIADAGILERRRPSRSPRDPAPCRGERPSRYPRVNAGHECRTLALRRLAGLKPRLIPLSCGPRGMNPAARRWRGSDRNMTVANTSLGRRRLGTRARRRALSTVFVCTFYGARWGHRATPAGHCFCVMTR